MTSIITRDLPEPASAKRLAWLLGIASVAAVCIVFWPVFQAELVAWGDDAKIYENPRIKAFSFENLKWMFTHSQSGLDYHPLTWLTWAIMNAVAGPKPIAFHYVNLLLHCLNAAMLFFLMPKLLRLWAGDRWSVAHHRHTYVASAVATLVWALHPLRVEPVAWASGLPYGLALLFMLMALYFYIHPYVSNDTAIKARVFYWFSFACFVAAVLSSPLVITFPVLLILIDRYVPEAGTGKTGLLRPDRPKWRAQLPFVLVSAVFMLVIAVARYCQSGAAWKTVFSFEQFSVAERIMQAFYICGYYVWKVGWPHPLKPLDTTLVSFDPLAAPFLASAVAVVIVTYLCFRSRRKSPTAWRLWVAYVALLLPALGLLDHPHFPSDCHAFVVALLWSWLLAGVLYRLCLRVNIRAAACGLSTLVLAALAAVSASQIAVWQTSETLLGHMLRTTPPESPHRSRIAFMLGRLLIEDGLYPEAIAVLTRHLEAAPDDSFAHHVVAGWYSDISHVEKAKFHYREAARLRPDEPAYYNDLGVLLARGGERVVAHDVFERALRVNPNYAIACHNLGLLLNEEGKKEEAEALFAKAQALRLLR